MKLVQNGITSQLIIDETFNVYFGDNRELAYVEYDGDDKDDADLFLDLFKKYDIDFAQFTHEMCHEGFIEYVINSICLNFDTGYELRSIVRYK